MLSATAGTITADKKCSLVQKDGPFIEVSVSDPTQQNTGSIALQIATDGGTLASADAGVSVTQSSPTIALSVNVNGAAGRTFKARFYLGTPDTVSVPRASRTRMSMMPPPAWTQILAPLTL